jgi:hypothetical protein
MKVDALTEAKNMGLTVARSLLEMIVGFGERSCPEIQRTAEVPESIARPLVSVAEGSRATLQQHRARGKCI